MFSASASSWKASLSPPMIAMPMRVTNNPQSSGIMAATGERKTSSSSTIRIGKAIFSPWSSESSEASLIARTRGARPDTSVSTGGWTLSSCRSTAGMVSSEICSAGLFTCSVSSAWPGGSARRGSPPMAKGLRTVTSGMRSRRRTSWRASRSSARSCEGGAFSRIAMLIVPPNCCSLSFAARSASVPGIWSWVSCRLSRALPARKSATTKAPTQKIRIGTGRRIARRAISLI